jgi:beta-galactosidase/beta-glucuronidase
MKRIPPFVPSAFVYAVCLLTADLVFGQWKPAETRLMTDWGRALKPDAVWTEYPRPQMQRGNWTNLNGLWSYAISAREAAQPTNWDGQLLVPFAPEAPLSGVGRLVEPTEALWYRRTFTARKASGQQTLLNFEAVDYDATVWVNGKELGSHRGGHTPFVFDITNALLDGENELVVRVLDATEGYQLHGKQKLRNQGIWYTRVTGIWQTVWLEQVPSIHLRDLNYACDIDKGTITVTPEYSKPDVDVKIRVQASIAGQAAVKVEGTGPVTIAFKNPQLWSPEVPNLYELKVDLLNTSGTVIDSVTAYTALRKFGKSKNEQGHWQLTLNNKPIFQWGPLDQGWWPDGLLTPPSDAAMKSDIEFLKACGFNMIRKHIKVEPRRYYHHCDTLGMIVWQDQVSNGYGKNRDQESTSPNWTRMAPNPNDAKWPDEAHQQWVTEYKRMVEHLRDAPCIGVWIPFNEAWGQHATMEVGKLATELDPTRLINIASGGNFWPVGDIADHHEYPHPAFPVKDQRFNDYVKVVGEFGGHGWPVKDHLWKPDANNWGYGGLPKSIEEWQGRYQTSIGILAALRAEGIAAGIYTQTTDVEGEINGLLTYDRLKKADVAWLRKQSEILLAAPTVLKDRRDIVATAEMDPQSWQYVTAAPTDKWMQTEFDATSWQTGPAGFGAGSPPPPGAPIKSAWTTPEIWVRRTFELSEVPQDQVYLRLYHDEDCIVYINGTEVARFSGYSTNYVNLALASKGHLVKGKNVLAIYCKQTGGGQFIDAGLFTAR